MAEVTVTVQDLYRMIGSREVMIERQNLRIQELERQLALQVAQTAVPQRVDGDGRP